MRTERLELFRAVEGQIFSAWFKKFEIHLKREKLEAEDDKIDELFVYLEGKPMNWYLQYQKLKSLPKTLKEIQMMGKSLEKVRKQSVKCLEVTFSVILSNLKIF